jgi:hypothetical protein
MERKKNSQTKGVIFVPENLDNGIKTRIFTTFVCGFFKENSTHHGANLYALIRSPYLAKSSKA